MFWHLYKNRLKILFKNKTLLFWNMAFPFILGTLFYMAFSSITEKTESINTIPVAITTTSTSKVSIEELHNSENLAYLFEMIDTLSEEKYITAKEMDFQKGENALEEGTITGIITVNEKNGELSLIVKDSGIDETILKEILDTCKRNTAVLSDIAMSSPEKLEQAAEALFSESSFRKELPLNTQNTDIYAQYFFALIAMTCLYGANLGLENTKQLQADQSVIGARRSISPTSKLLAVLSDFGAALTIEMGIYFLLLFYLTQILGINLGNNLGKLILIGLCSNMVGVSLGYFLGVFLKGEHRFKESIVTAVVLTSDFFAGLMVGEMKYIMECNLPIFNRINPAAIISDCYQYTCVFDDAGRFHVCILSLLIWNILLFIAAILILRREKYANL